MTATASRWWHSPVLFLISSGIRFFLLFVVGFSTGGHISLLLSALSVLNSFLFAVYCFSVVYALRRQRLHAVPISGTHTLVDI